MGSPAMQSGLVWTAMGLACFIWRPRGRACSPFPLSGSGMPLQRKGPLFPVQNQFSPRSLERNPPRWAFVPPPWSEEEDVATGRAKRSQPDGI